MNVLYAWVGKSDLRASEPDKRKDDDSGSGFSRPAGDNKLGRAGNGPVADTLLHLADELDCAVLLFDCSEDEASNEETGGNYVRWLEQQLAQVGMNLNITRRLIVKGDPTSFNWVYDAMRKVVSEHECGRLIEKRHYLVGPGTPTMAACTLIVARLAACAGTLWQTDIMSPQGCRSLELPFDLNLKDAPDPASHAAERAPGEQSAAQHTSGAPIVLSATTKRAWELAERAAPSPWPVLILGSTGTGKEELAKYIHQRSDRKGKLISLNCGAIPANLIEAKLFGNKKGAYTGALAAEAGAFEAAGDGTLFLDEVGELPLEAQTRFLRVLQEKKIVRLGEHDDREVNCRIIAATYRNLWRAVEEGSFRADLYYRLAGLIIMLDDLAERPEDLHAMIDRFWLGTVESNPGFPGRVLSEEARQRLLAHSWPGNVRELKSTLVRTAFLAQAPQVSATDVELALARFGDQPPHAKPGVISPVGSPVENGLPAIGQDLDFKASTKRYQRELVQQALSLAGGNKSRAARTLGLSVQHLGRLLKD